MALHIGALIIFEPGKNLLTELNKSHIVDLRDIPCKRSSMVTIITEFYARSFLTIQYRCIPITGVSVRGVTQSSSLAFFHSGLSPLLVTHEHSSHFQTAILH